MTRQNWWKVAVPMVAVASMAVWALRASAHCEIPCGIYDDPTRIKLLYEHIATIEKSMQQIVALSKDPKDHNQITRWVMNKEAHCDEFQHIATQYFMTQRVKPLTPDADQATKTKYVKQLTLLHEMLVYAMKAKQTTDTANTDKLKQLVHDFEHDYFGTSR